MKIKILLAILAAIACCTITVLSIVLSLKPHEHTYEKEVTAPTCLNQGYTVYTCTECKYSYTSDYVEALGHDYTNYTSDNNATCTKDGTKTATCNHEGCNEHNTIADEGSKLGHLFTNYVSDNNATCTSDGTKTATCEREGCNEHDNITDEGSKLGHLFTNYVSDNNAACTKDGTKTATCNREGCNEHNTIADEGTKLEHELTHVGAKESTCTEIGWDEHDECIHCDFSTANYVPAKGHTYTDWIIDSEATCTTDGMKHRDCTVCHEAAETRVINKYDHNLIHHDGKEPTCTEIGWEAYDECSRGDYSSYVELPAKGHTSSDWIVGKETTCEESGYRYKECTACHAILEREDFEPLGHNLTHYVGKEATCTEIGWEAYDACSRCEHTTYKELPAKGHTSSTPVSENIVEATCLEGGHYDSVVYCSSCHEELSREYKTIDPLGHSFTHYISNNDATVTSDGTKTATCDRDGCDVTDTVTDYGTMIGHVFGEPTWVWTDYGNVKANFTCTICEEEHIESYAATISSEITLSPTCEKSGERTYTAKIVLAGVEYSDTRKENVDSLGHEYKVVWVWTGYESAKATFTCIHDNNHIEERVATIDNITNEITTPATCLEEGERTYTATVTLNETEYTNTKTKTIDATGHTLHDNTCTSCGYDAGGSTGLNMVLNV